MLKTYQNAMLRGFARLGFFDIERVSVIPSSDGLPRSSYNDRALQTSPPKSAG
jgi:hypothetical protein